jgi:hypothetical protein
MGSYDENRPWDIIWAQSWYNWCRMVTDGFEVDSQAVDCDWWG